MIPIIWSAADIALATRLPSEGSLLMLQCFFDDSGTHGAATVVVWGGVVGIVDQFVKLESEWNHLLNNPPHGKPPIKKFSVSNCRARQEEFLGYNEAESAHLEYCFREIIIRSGVVPVSYGTDVAAWNRLVTGKLRDFVGSAESASYGLCAKIALQTSVENNEKISIVFDQGRMRPILQRVFGGACALVPEGARVASTTFSPVTGTPGLQATDLAAHYFYSYAIQWAKNNRHPPDPHLESLLRSGLQIVDGFMGEPEILDMVRSMRANNEWLRD